MRFEIVYYEATSDTYDPCEGISWKLNLEDARETAIDIADAEGIPTAVRDRYTDRIVHLVPEC